MIIMIKNNHIPDIFCFLSANISNTYNKQGKLITKYYIYRDSNCDREM